MEEWLDQPDMWIEVLHPDDREIELAAHDLHSTHRRSVAPRVPADRRSEGQVVWVRDHATLMRDPDGNPDAWQGVMIDITAEKEAQQAIATAPTTSSSSVCGHAPRSSSRRTRLMGIEIAERQRAENERDRASDSLGDSSSNVPAVVYLWQAREREHGDMVHLRRRADRADARLHARGVVRSGLARTRPPARRRRVEEATHRTASRRRAVPARVSLPRARRARRVGDRPRHDAASATTRASRCCSRA